MLLIGLFKGYHMTLVEKWRNMLQQVMKHVEPCDYGTITEFLDEWIKQTALVHKNMIEAMIMHATLLILALYSQ